MHPADKNPGHKKTPVAAWIPGALESDRFPAVTSAIARTRMFNKLVCVTYPENLQQVLCQHPEDAPMALFLLYMPNAKIAANPVFTGVFRTYCVRLHHAKAPKGSVRPRIGEERHRVTHLFEDDQKNNSRPVAAGCNVSKTLPRDAFCPARPEAQTRYANKFLAYILLSARSAVPGVFSPRSMQND